MDLLTIKVDKRGRITIPEEIRKKLEIKESEPLYLKKGEGYFIIYPSKSIKIKFPK